MHSKCNQMSYSELSTLLKELGIEEITSEILTDLDKQWASFPEEILDSMEKVTLLLSTIGMGKYDFDTNKWAPTSKQVYSFDMEACDISNAYTFLLNGVSSISSNDLTIHNIIEKDFISFDLNGKRYTFTPNSYDDWMDITFLNYLHEILEIEKSPKQLYFTSDGYQSCIVFYATKEWVSKFTDVTGCELYSEIN